MYTSMRDDAEGLLVAIWSGASNVDADYDAVVEDIAASSRAGVKTGAAVVRLMFADAENPTPNAAQRQRIVGAVRSDTGPKSQFFVMITPSILIRGVVTAIAWFAPPTHKTSAHATLDEALAWIEERRPGVVARLREMSERVRTRAGARDRLSTPRATG